MNRNVPEIRFGEFEGDWEECPFGSTFSIMQNNTLSRAEMHYGGGLAKSIHYGDVLIKLGEHIDVAKTLLPYITNSRVVAAMEASKLANGDVVMADTAEDETAGKCVEVNGISDVKIISGLHTMPCRPSKKFAPGYLGFYMNSPAYHKQLIPLMQGTKVTSISREALKETFLRFSRNLAEQEKIVNILDSINENITTATDRHDKLLALKKALLQKMFPQEGESVPRIRFGEFEGEWELKRLSTIAEEIIRKDEKSNAPVMMISSAIGFIYQTDRYSGNNAGKSLKDYIILKKDELAYNHGYSKLRPFGSCFSLKEEEARVPFVYHCFSVPNDDARFVSIQLNSSFVEQ